MSRSMDHNARRLLSILIFTLINICLAWPQNAIDSDSIAFPKDDHNDEPALGNRIWMQQQPIDHNCTWREVWYPSTNLCEELLTIGPCENHQWLVLGDDNVPQCKERDCPDKQIMFKNQCVLIDQLNTTMCRPGMRIIATETGQGDCDCQRGHVYWNNLTRGEQDRCYSLYRKGPCQNGKILHISNDIEDAKPACRPNRCKEGSVAATYRNGTLIPWTGRCYQLSNPGPCLAGLVVGIDNESMQLACVPALEIRALINAPVLNCTPGSKRDALGRCRRSMF